MPTRSTSRASAAKSTLTSSEPYRTPDTDWNLTHLERERPGSTDLLRRLHFNPIEGQIWLGDWRMLLVDADSFASLRDDLIDLVGMEVARGALTRMGYRIGMRIADLARKIWGNESPEKLFATGPFLHALTGFIKSEPLRMNLDIANGICDCEFVIRHSAEHRVATDDRAHHGGAACWLMVGQASGFLTGLLGRPVLVREFECEATGGERCFALSKLVEDWGPDAADDLRYFTASPVKHPVVAAPFENLMPEPPTPVATADAAMSKPDIIGSSPAMSVVLHRVRRVASTRATVLLLGESGVGKSMIARELHRYSQRPDQPLVEVNCAAIPDTLLESELFGVERGAYTGATQSRSGRFEAANGGSLFLDEIATLSLAAQGKLLRVLQSGELERLGSTRTIKVNVRVIAATNVNLQHEVQEGRFREDLFYRLNVFPIVIPPLRDRREDLPALLDGCLARLSAFHGRRVGGVTPRALRAILNYSWPGNIREFENVIERGLILAEDGELLDLHHLFRVGVDLDMANVLSLTAIGTLEPCGSAETSLEAQPENKLSTAETDWVQLMIENDEADLVKLESRLIEAAMQATRGNVSQAAKRLGLTRAQLDYRLKRSY